MNLTKNRMLNKTKIKILENTKRPIRIKDLKEKTGLKYSNLSIQLNQLIDDKIVMVVGKEGKSKVVQTNELELTKHLNSIIGYWTEVFNRLL